jgi:pyruvate dehydrogenase E2 component (dihydrolipoamide acetyltransferase)
MATKIHMEALSPTMEEGQVVRWLKSEGDPVANGEVLAEIETDKATMELVARGEGVLRTILMGEGGTAPVGEVIGIIGDADEDIEALIPARATETVSSSGQATAAETPPVEKEGSEAVGPLPSVEGDPRVDALGVSAEGADPRSTGEEVRVKASPLARRVAREANLDLRTVPGSGPRGRIIMRDVEAATKDLPGMSGFPVSVSGPSSPAEAVSGTFAGQARSPGLDFEDQPLSQMRKTIARRLVESLSPVPHFFLRITVDMRRTLEARERVNGLLESRGEKVSINDFILKATAAALERHPEVNAEWTGEAIRRHYRVHLGVAVAVEDGLITPVIRDANQKGLAQISREIRELAARGREKRLMPEEYTGSTFSVSNLGMFGIHEFTGVINPPEAGILAVGGIEETPAVAGDQVVVKLLMKVTMSCDHRVIDGATGARFLQTLKEMLEEPAAILV